MIAIQCYPEHKGLVTGFIVGCFAFGSFIFNFVASYVVNPENKKPKIEKTFGDVTDKYFEREIAENVPTMFIVLGSIYAFIIVCALFMIQDIKLKPTSSSLLPDEDSDHDEQATEGGANKKGEYKKSNPLEKVDAKSNQINKGSNHITFVEALKTRNFYLIFFTTMFAGTAGMFSIASFKVIGLEYGYNDTFLTVVGSLGSVMNGTNRPFWGWLFDKKSYRLTYVLLCIIEVIVCFTFPLISGFQVPFLIWLCILFSCSGGTITQLAPISVKLYGKDVGFRVYALLFLSNGFASMSVFFIQTYITLYLDRVKIFYVIGGLSAGALIIISFFKEIKHTS
jgi:hypothetical protein